MIFIIVYSSCWLMPHKYNKYNKYKYNKFKYK